MKSVKIEDKKLADFLEQTVWSHYSSEHKQKIAKFQNEEENSPKVGIFWLIPAKIIDNEEVLLYAEQALFNASHVDMFYDAAFEHYVIWDTVRIMFSELKNAEYEEYPRGRVTFVAKNYPQDGMFKLMADVEILRQKECLQTIKQIFNTGDYKVEVLRDAHYRT